MNLNPPAVIFLGTKSETRPPILTAQAVFLPWHIVDYSREHVPTDLPELGDSQQPILVMLPPLTSKRQVAKAAKLVEKYPYHRFLGSQPADSQLKWLKLRPRHFTLRAKKDSK